MRILLAQTMLYAPNIGGAVRCNRATMEGLAERGHACRVVALSIAPEPGEERARYTSSLAAEGIHLHRDAVGADRFAHNGVSVHATHDLRRLRRIFIEQVREFDPTHILVSSEDVGQTLLEAALALRPGRVVYLAHTPQLFPFGPASFHPSRGGTQLVRRASAVVAIGTRTASYIRDASGLDPVVIHPPVYGEGPFPHYGRADSGLVTLINPSKIKGLPIFRALARVFPRCEFAAVASWATTVEDRETLARLPNVRLFETVPDIDEVFQKTRILLVPSLWQEGFGIVVVEAMLRGIVVLASNVGGLLDAKLGVEYVLPVRPIEQYEDRTDDRGNPVPVMPDQDVRPWADALDRLLTDPRHYDEISARSRDTASRFASTLGVSTFEDLLQDRVATEEPTYVRGGRSDGGGDPVRADALRAFRRLRGER